MYLNYSCLIKVVNLQKLVAEAHAAVKSQKEMLSTQNKEINSKAAQKEKIIKESGEFQLEIKQLDHKLSKLKSETKEAETRV